MKKRKKGRKTFYEIVKVNLLDVSSLRSSAVDLHSFENASVFRVSAVE